MKYIRTKEGRIIDTDKNSGLIFTAPDGRQIIDFNINGWFEIIEQSDTIEELCDEAVAVYPDGTHDNCSVMHIVDNNGFREAVYGCLSVSVDDLKKDYECWEIYGAIWTSWGLKYVAKMNENGELVLICKI